MKRLSSLLLIMAFVLSGCSAASQPTLDPVMIYTQAAQTVQAQMNQIASQTPPTPTATLTATPEPTMTASPSPEPSLTPTQPWVFNPPGKVTAPILLYTVIADNADDDPYFQWESPLNVGSLQFEQEMLALKESGYESITISQLTTAIWEGAELPPRPVVITFDSNKLGTYKKAFPIMQKYGFVGTIFVVVNQLDGNGVLTTAQIKEMQKAGWEIGSKGMSGASLLDRMDNLGDEISGSRLALEEKLGVPVTSFSYPGGAIDDGGKITSRVQSWGYKGAVGIFKTVDHTIGSVYYLARYEIRKDLPLDDFLTILPWKSETPLSDRVKNFLTPNALAPVGGTAQPEPSSTETPQP